MGHSASITIGFARKLPSIVEALNVLIRSGWRVDGFEGNVISYLPLDDNGDFAYEFEEPANWPKVLAIIEKKSRRQEMVGITLTCEDTQGDFLFAADHSSLEVSINNVNRKQLANCGRFTDYSWYLAHIVCPLFNAVGSVDVVKCTDLS